MPQTPVATNFTDPEQWLKQQPAPKPPLERLTAFARKRGLRVTSTTGGRHNPGSKHPVGRAIDFGTKELDPASVNQAIEQGEALGYRVLDERQRPPGQREWSGPHVHLEDTPTAAQFDQFTDPDEWLQKNDDRFSDPDEWLKKQAPPTPPAESTDGKDFSLWDGKSSLTDKAQAQQKNLPPAAAPRTETPYVEKFDAAPAFASSPEFNQAEAERLKHQKPQIVPDVRTLPLPYSQQVAEAAPEEGAPQARKVRIGAHNWQDLTGAKLTQSLIATLPQADREAAKYVFSLIPKDEANDIWTEGAQLEETKLDGKATGYAATVGVPKWVEIGIAAYKQGGAAAAHKAIQDRMTTEAEYTKAANEKEAKRQEELHALQQNATNGIDDGAGGKATAIDRSATAGMGEGFNKLVGGAQGIAAATAGRLGLDSVDHYLSEASQNSYDQANLTNAIANQATQQANLSPVTAGVARGIGAAPLALAELAVPQFGALSELSQNANQPLDQALGHAFMTEMSGLGMQALQTAGLVGRIDNRALQVIARSAEGAALNTLMASPELVSQYQKAPTPEAKQAVLAELVSAAVIGAIQPNLPRTLGGQGMPHHGGEVAPTSYNPIGEARTNHDALLRDFTDQAERGINELGKPSTPSNEQVQMVMTDPQVKQASDAVGQARARVDEVNAKIQEDQQRWKRGEVPIYHNASSELQLAQADLAEAIQDHKVVTEAKLQALASEAKSVAPTESEKPNASVPKETAFTDPAQWLTAQRESSQQLENGVESPAVPTADSLLARLRSLSKTNPEGAAESSNSTLAEQINQSAHEAATSPLNDLPLPSEAQIAAGNYKKGSISLHGLDISIENPQDSTRAGVGADGKPWSITMQNHYGYLKGRGNIGADGEPIDVYIGDHPESEKVFIVDQVDKNTSQFDEHKVILGARDQAEAENLYDAHFNDGKGAERRGAVSEMDMPAFKDWLKNGDTTNPINKSVELATPEAGVLEKSANAARERLTQALQGKQANDLTQVVGDLSVLAAHHIYQGGKVFSKWATAMVNEFGAKVRQALGPAWEQARKFWQDERGELDESAPGRAIMAGGKWASEKLGGEKLRDKIYTTKEYAKKVPLPANFDLKQWAQAAHDAAQKATLDATTVKHADRLINEAVMAVQQKDGGRFAEINEKLNQVLRPRAIKIVSAIGDVQRTASASGEFSFLLRQGRKLAIMEPTTWAKAAPEIIKGAIPYRQKDASGKKLGSLLFNDAAKQRYFNTLAEIKADPKWSIAEKAGLDVAAIGETEFAAAALTHEETTSTGVARQIPILKQSERGNKAFMAKLAFNAFKARVERAGLDQVTAADIANKTPDGLKVKRLAKDLNVLSGRADVGEKLRSFVNVTAPVAFSPRYAISNFQTLARYNPLQLARYFGANPAKYGKLSNLNPQRLLPERDAVSMQRANDAAKMTLYHLGVIAAIGGLTKAGLPVSVEWQDVDSPDFMKLKVGNQRYDIGMVGNTLRYVLRMAKRGIEASEQGREPLGKALDQTGQFARQKESPLASLMHDQAYERIKGKQIEDVDTGEKVSVGRNAIGEIKTLKESLAERAYPITWQQIVNAVKDGKTADLIPALAEAIGEGAQSYESRLERISPNTKTMLTRDYSSSKGYEPQARFEQRVKRAQEMYQAYFPRLQNSAYYKQADDEDKVRLETSLTNKIKEASYQETARIDLGKLLENAKRGEKAMETKEKKGRKQQALQQW